jgi:hypothetical protein
MGTVATLITANDWPEDIARELESIAAMLRSGELVADQGVLILRNTTHGRMHEPARLGSPTSPIEVMGMCAYASQRYYNDEVDPE